MESLAQRLITTRLEKKWSQDDLANKVGIRQSFIGALEAGNQKTSGWLPEIAYALGVDAYWLKTGKGDKFRGSAPLSADEAQIITAYRLFGDEMRRAWLAAARHRIAEEDAVKNKAA